MSLSDIVSLIAIISFLGGIAIFLFKKIVIEPLRNSIDQLNATLKEFRASSEKRMELIEKRIDIVEDQNTRHDEQIKTLFNSIKGEM